MNPKLQKAIIDSIERNPQDWVIEGDKPYTLRNKKTGIELWISNAPYADLKVWRPVETGRMRGFFVRRKVRKLIAPYIEFYHYEKQKKEIEITNTLNNQR